MAERWLADDPDPQTKKELKTLLSESDLDLESLFGAKLLFGTAGLRGVLGPGPNRMNRLTVMRATSGLCAWLKQSVPDAAERGVCIGFDGRTMSLEFADDVARVLNGAGFRVFRFNDVCPTPLLGFAVLKENAAAGVMITASHNPPAYNGYKVFWGQRCADHSAP